VDGICTTRPLAGTRWWCLLLPHCVQYLPSVSCLEYVFHKVHNILYSTKTQVLYHAEYVEPTLNLPRHWLLQDIPTNVSPRREHSYVRTCTVHMRRNTRRGILLGNGWRCCSCRQVASSRGFSHDAPKPTLWPRLVSTPKWTEPHRTCTYAQQDAKPTSIIAHTCVLSHKPRTLLALARTDHARPIVRTPPRPLQWTAGTRLEVNVLYIAMAHVHFIVWISMNYGGRGTVYL